MSSHSLQKTVGHAWDQFQKKFGPRFLKRRSQVTEKGFQCVSFGGLRDVVLSYVSVDVLLKPFLGSIGKRNRFHSLCHGSQTLREILFLHQDAFAKNRKISEALVGVVPERKGEHVQWAFQPDEAQEVLFEIFVGVNGLEGVDVFFWLRKGLVTRLFLSALEPSEPLMNDLQRYICRFVLPDVQQKLVVPLDAVVHDLTSKEMEQLQDIFQTLEEVGDVE
mmetsp:Transcript_6078/g.14872  ORF Transcript_6078/g.14872 Transcript_6078/m.14872 type:complete len:220 (+) Transcript_6078:5391-6050(+)